MNEETLRKIKAFRIRSMVETYMNIENDPLLYAPTFDEKLSIMVDNEESFRLARRIINLIKKANFA